MLLYILLVTRLVFCFHLSSIFRWQEVLIVSHRFAFAFASKYARTAASDSLLSLLTRRRSLVSPSVDGLLSIVRLAARRLNIAMVRVQVAAVGLVRDMGCRLAARSHRAERKISKSRLHYGARTLRIGAVQRRLAEP